MNDDPNYYANSRTEVAAFVPAGAQRVLEIGCGLGNFRRNFPDTVEYWGVEAMAAVAHAAEASLDRVLAGSYREVCAFLPDGYFDLVVCNDVIEHMDDHDGFLRDIQVKMRAGHSYLVGSVPNVRYITNLHGLLVRRDWQYVDAGILDRTHLRFFTQRSLARTLGQHGFTIERLAGINRIELHRRSMGYRLQASAAHLAALVLGQDTLFAQFAFRASLDR
ncbi:MAG: methyltransferase domain-containing protein [Burkholderiales bacterium]|nr:methyltransferase domain-containing protein [Burkholderiales bacterium]